LNAFWTAQLTVNVSFRRPGDMLPFTKTTAASIVASYCSYLTLNTSFIGHVLKEVLFFISFCLSRKLM
jgi:hypothetical protein